MTLKDIDFSVAMYGTTPIIQSNYDVAYTGDESSINLRFAVTDEPDLEGATAIVHLKFADSSHIERALELTESVFSYTLKGTENKHAGVVRADIIITKGGAKFTRAGHKFKIDTSLDASVPLVEFSVDTLDTLVDGAEEWLLQAQIDFGTAQSQRAEEWVADNDARADEFAESQTDRTNAFDASEAARTTDFNASETGRSNTFTVNENAREAAAESGEAARDESFELSEYERTTTFGESEAGRVITFNGSEAGRTIAFNLAEEARSEGYANDHDRAGTDHTRAENDHDIALTDQENYVTLLTDLQETINDANENIAEFDVALQNGIVATNIAAELQNLEETYAPDLVTVKAQLEQKAEQTALDTQTGRINNLVANAGNTDGNAELLDIRVRYGGETAATAGTAMRAIDKDISSLYKTSANLCDDNLLISGEYVIETTGLLTANAGYKRTFLVKTKPNTVYYFGSKKGGNIGGVQHSALYKADKTYLSALTSSDLGDYNSFNSGAGEYAMLSFSSAITGFYLSERPLFFSFYEPSSKSLLFDNVANKTTQNGNLLDVSKIISGYFLSKDGWLTASASYFISQPIRVLAGDRLDFTSARFVTYYNDSYVADLSKGSENANYATFNADGYVILTMSVSDLAFAYIGKGYVVKGKPYNKLINENEIAKNRTPLAFIPDIFYCAVGRTIEIYNNQVCIGDTSDLTFRWICDIGKNLKRKFSVTGATIGNYELKLQILSQDLVVVYEKTATLKVVSNVMTAKTINPIGDSLTNGKAWLQECRTLSGNLLSYVGTRGVAPLKHEGRSGFSSATYLAPTLYTYESEGLQPYWNASNSRFDFANYKTVNGLTPDAVQLFLGTNDLDYYYADNLALKQIVDYIRLADANIPIFLCFTIYKGNQNGIGSEINVDGYTATNKGMTKFSEDLKVFNLMKKLHTLMSGYANVYFVPLSLCHDTENNFKLESKPVNPRASQTEIVQTTSVHPETQGYLQMADVMYSAYCAAFNT